MSNPITSPQDYIVIAGQRSPGICEISGADSPRRWDERRGYGLSGARAVYRGTALSKPRITLHLLNAEHFEAWNSFREMLLPPPAGERAQALEVEHPFLADLGIRALNVVNLKQPVQTDHGKWTVEIETIEYREPQPALSTPRGADSGEALSPNQILIRDLTAEVAARAPVRPR